MNRCIKNFLKPIVISFMGKLNLIVNVIQRNFTKKPIIRDVECILENIINEKCSLSRFGDGELNLIQGIDIDFQKYDKELADRLKSILKSNNSNILIAIPDVFGSLNKYIRNSQEYWTSLLVRKRFKWYKCLDKEKTYYNAFISRPYMIYKDKSKCKQKFDLIKNIWKEKDVIIVEGGKSRLGVGNDLFNNCKSIKRILCPTENSYSKYTEIFKCVKENVTSELVLIALGPTASILAYDLSEQGIQAIDIGHIDIEYEWFLNKYTTKRNIYGKYTNECGARIVEDIGGEVYKKQIIKIIG